MDGEELGREGRRERGRSQMSRLDQGHQRYSLGLKMGPSAHCCIWLQIWIPEIEYFQKVSSHAQIGPQAAQKQLRKV